MKKLFFLNTREKKQIIDKLKQQFGFSGKLNYSIIRNESDEIFLVSSSVGEINLEDLRLKQIGLKLGKLINKKQIKKKQEQEILLTTEAAQLIGPESNKNIVEIGDFQLKKWFLGKDIDIFLEKEDIYLIKAKNKETNTLDFIGCAKYKHNKLINSLPREKRQEVI